MADLPGHKWKSIGTEGNHFLYRCSKCHHVTLSGVALVAPFNKACK